MASKPVKGNPRITTKFGVPNRYALFGKHSGIDYSLAPGTGVYAPASGRVSNVKSRTGGNMVVLHDGKYYHRLMHNSRFRVKSGSKVKEGDRIADSGNTGLSTGPHLHWDINTQGTYPSSFSKFVDPNKWLKGGSMSQTLTSKNHLKVLFRQFVGRDPKKSEYSYYLGKKYDVALNKLHKARKDLPKLLKDLKSAKNKPPKEVVKLVEKIVEKEVEVEKVVEVEIPVEVEKPHTVKGAVEFLISKLKKLFKR